jgi:hypothetical protein
LDGKPHDRFPCRVAAAVLVIGFGVMLALNAPGQLSYDSVTQLADGLIQDMYRPYNLRADVFVPFRQGQSAAGDETGEPLVRPGANTDISR